ncbi:MAG: hypothetical protein Q4G36_11520 [Paracoccus sp. (in: a-proteobacteria)]|nr:hypothetical protein [Paracoccus sp. (in: a-proteobacteria)]
MSKKRPKTTPSASFSDTPSMRELKSQLAAVKFIKTVSGGLLQMGIMSGNVKEIYNSAENVLSQIEIINLPDRFNKAFSDNGWIASSSFPLEAAKEALRLHDAGETARAEQTLIDSLTEKHINLFAIRRGQYVQPCSGRKEQLEEALRLTFEERYIAAVPLILIACDGFMSDILHKSPFAEGVDLTVFDSMVGHGTGLPNLLKTLYATARKTSEAELNLPLRHPILHGRALGYANKAVCMKAWSLMIAFVDWAHDLESENSRKAEQERRQAFGMEEFLESARQREADKRILESFTPRRIDAPLPEQLEPESPEAVILNFLQAWQQRNYGKMASAAFRGEDTPINRLAGEMREDVSHAQLESFEVIFFEQFSATGASARVQLRGSNDLGRADGLYKVNAWRIGKDANFSRPSAAGRWSVAYGCVSDLRNGRTVPIPEKG